MLSAISPEGWGCSLTHSPIMCAQPAAHANLAAFFAVFVLGNNLLGLEESLKEVSIYKGIPKHALTTIVKTNPYGVPKGFVFTINKIATNFNSV